MEDEPPIAKRWEGSLELGLDGASDNNESLNFRLGLNAKRQVALLTLREGMQSGRPTGGRSLGRNVRATLHYYPVDQ